ncbi:Exocyst complex component 1 [Irineochytrium annulatum]|nr:Exocyst complex component 1 [Irineochytrium annulatum]
MQSLEAVRMALIKELFPEQDGTDGDKLLFHVGVRDGVRSQDPLDGRKRRPSADELKIRYLCVTVKKGKSVKIRIHKVKPEKGEGFVISKSWDINDVKCLESGKDTQLSITFGKNMFTWDLEDGPKKIEFMYTLLEMSKQYAKKPPKLINLDEELLHDQLKFATAGNMGTAEKILKEALSDEVSMSKPATNPKKAEVVEAYHDLEEESPASPDLSPKPGGKEDQQQQPSVDLNEILADFSWQANGDSADLELKLIEELQALESANVHAIIQSEDPANAVIDQIDQALAQLNEIDDWLMHYTNMLDASKILRMGQDVHQVEVRNKAMQIASSNQKGLLSELESIIASLKLPAFVVETLRNEPLDDVDGIVQCERATKELRRVLGAKLDSLSELGMVTERMSLYNGYARQFSSRLSEHLSSLISSMVANWASAESLLILAKAEMYSADKTADKTKMRKGTPRIGGHDVLEQKLYRYRKLIRWMKDMDARKQKEVEMSYIQDMSRVYRLEMHAMLEYLKTNIMNRKVSAEEQEFYLFSQHSMSASSALTALGSKTITNLLPPSEMKKKAGWRLMRKKSTHHTSSAIGEEEEGDDTSSIMSKSSHLRVGSDDRRGMNGSVSSLEVGGTAEEKMLPDEIIGFIYSALCPQMVREQNFLADVLGMRKEEVDEGQSAEGWQEELSRSREHLRDIKLQNRMHLEDIKKQYENAAYSYIANHLDMMLKRLASLLDKFIHTNADKDEQIKAVEETKVTLKKRSGILPFVRTFPRFLDRLEAFIEEPEGFTRNTVSKAYERLVKIIFDALDAVAKDSSADLKDPRNADDKEQLNIHILTVENMHHFYSEVRSRKVAGLDPFVRAAKALYDVNLGAYVKVVIRKPLGKMMEFFEGIDDLLKTLAAEEVSFHLQFSKAAVKEIIKKYPGKEIKKGLEQLYKRVDKHYSDEEGLLQVVWRGIQEEFTKQLKRYEEIISLCYPEAGLKIEFTIEDLLGYFSELARAH